MAPPMMSREWEKFASGIDLSEPKSVSEYRERRSKAGHQNQTLLSTPTFDVLNNVDVENISVALPEIPNHAFPTRIYRPQNIGADEKLPIMLYFHGGFWCAGDANSEDFGCRAIISRGNRLIIASFEYRLVPDVTWDVQFEDAEKALLWVSKNAKNLGADVGKGFLVGGAEAGAHLAAMTAIRARDRHPEIKLTGQCLIVPTLISWPDKQIPQEWKARLHSHTENAEAPVLSEKTYEMFLANLGVPDTEKRKGENFPMWADLGGLPPTYLPMDECDPIRDQGFLYNELLCDAGVRTRTDYYRGLPNMFVQFPQLSTTLVAGGHLAAAFAWLLQDRK